MTNSNRFLRILHADTRPDDPVRGAHYIVINNGSIRLKHIDYEGSMIREEMGQYWQQLRSTMASEVL
ncbi:hypothetical protein [Paenibacillus koleovorans]|uniref:hypothetical protein n=1 Tax=Paenibacillus koleovorans TaxID=121608 RepID=UPI000FDA8C24|nr:hypothetical protein [Paenibacillus koleovorans]